MNPEIKEKWIEALQSGEYKQGQNSLKTDDGFCCLGVLCDIYAKEMNVPWEANCAKSYYYMKGEAEFLPHLVQLWAGLSCSPEVVDENNMPVRLVHLNDSGVDFRTIAGYIKKSSL
jgi:hypothetical protein